MGMDSLASAGPHRHRVEVLCLTVVYGGRTRAQNPVIFSAIERCLVSKGSRINVNFAEFWSKRWESKPCPCLGDLCRKPLTLFNLSQHEKNAYRGQGINLAESRREGIVLTPNESNWDLAEAATSSFAVSWEYNVWVRLPHASAKSFLHAVLTEEVDSNSESDSN
jgi:hypothetical protein